MSTTVEQIKERLGIVEVVSSYWRLEPAGANFRARCPFHQEKTPSFYVSPTRQSYHCFGCNRGGDIFSFVEEIEGLDFFGALKVLAERAGVTVEARSAQPTDQQERLYRLLEAATSFYQAQLINQPAALAYLAERGLNTTTIKDWRLGWAADSWRGVTDHLLRQGFSDAELAASGMTSQSTKQAGRFYDRFRSRIMFPLFDSAGRVVAFSGRHFGNHEETSAKYLNSPQTSLYDKSRLLYGFHRAKLPIRRADACVLVEGQFDLLLSHQAGIDHAVAVSGTALTEKHFTEPIKRLTKTLIMAFDGDAAGVQASYRAVALALGQGLEVKIAALPVGLDPADLIQQSPSAWRELIERARHVIDFFLTTIDRRPIDQRQKAHAVTTEVLPLIARLTNQVDQAYFISQIALLTGLAEEVWWPPVRALVAKSLGGAVTPMDRPATLPPPGSRREKITDQIIGLWWWQPTVVGEELTKHWPETRLADLAAKREDRRGALVLAAELSYPNQTAGQLMAELKELLAAWQQETQREQLADWRRQLAAAERRGDTVASQRCLAAIQALLK